ncbi:MAG: MGMT family protein [Candidatus Jordarchaeales archaeon]
MVSASVVEWRGAFVSVARGERGLLAATLPCRSADEAKRKIMEIVPSVETWDDDMCREVAEKIFRALEGECLDFNYEVDLSNLTPFQRKVLEEVRRIPPGETITYGELARRIGNPRAARAVGRALKRNPLPIVIPCHRVVGACGIGGYTGGLEIKVKLLINEKARVCRT